MPAPDPSRIIDALTAYWSTATLGAAIDLDLFTVLGRRALSGAELARTCRADRASLTRLCDALVSLGFLRARGGRYRATADAATFLDLRSARSIAGARRFFAGGTMLAAFAGLAGTIRRGRPARAAASDGRLWREFAAATCGLRRELGDEIADELQSRRLVRGRILDIGAGASPLGIELLRRERDATLVVLDRPAVVRVASRLAVRAGVAGRVTAVPGDALSTPWGGPYDLVLMINVLDYLGAQGRVRLLRTARRALRPGGALVVHAPLLDPRRTSPPEAVAYDLMLLALGAAGPASTEAELRGLLRRVGFSSIARSSGLPLLLARRPRSTASHPHATIRPA